MMEDFNRIALVLLAFFGTSTAAMVVAPWFSRAARQQRRALTVRLQEIREDRQPRSVLRAETRTIEVPERVERLLGGRLSAVLTRLHLRADVADAPAATLLRCIGLGATGLVAVTLLIGPAVGLVVALLVGSLPLVRLGLMARQRQARFARQFGQALEFLARSMRSGLDLPGAMRVACEEFPDPIATEFRRAVDEINYGMPVEAAIERIDERVDCRDLGYLSACVSIQRETGGGLAQSLNTLANAIRERRIFEGKVHGLSAQGRLSAWVLCILPLAVLALMMVTNPSYVGVLLDTTTGNKVLAGTLLMTAAGVVWVAMLVRVRI